MFKPPNQYVHEWTVIRLTIHNDWDDAFTLRRQESEGFHLWREVAVYNLFVSDEFLARFDAMKFKNLERVHCLEE